MKKGQDINLRCLQVMLVTLHIAGRRGQPREESLLENSCTKMDVLGTAFRTAAPFPTTTSELEYVSVPELFSSLESCS
jgi:hypothetical protein